MITPLPDDGLRDCIVSARQTLAEGVTLFSLTPQDRQAVADFAPGAHLSVRTPGGAMRRYSLLNRPDDGRYDIAVQCEPNGRGGSLSMTEDATVGEPLAVGEPVNEFALVEAPRYVFIAGGIGITPIISMVRSLERRGRQNYRLIYCCRTPERAAFRDELSRLGERVSLHYDGGDPERVYDFWPLCETPDDSHIYCCGPAVLMDEIRAMTGHWPGKAVHFENFRPVEVTRPDDTAFYIRLGTAGERLQVPAERSILETLRDAGWRVRSSCESGSCGTCKTRYLAGDVEHRDFVLDDTERRDHLMICVSRARAGELTLELEP